MRSFVALTLTLVLGCAARQGAVLLYPPEGPDAAAPHGQRLLTKSPLEQWRRDRTFASIEECDAWRKKSTDSTIDAARATQGDEARNDLGVRRAVNARCVAKP